ncbi:MAG: TIGR04372 family glycosyltransferase [Proteobacteria bacterium]|nr:TIGR04372 family glycosyltransferase [Pseudomonadota bacterium]MBI3496327.1 TIGR04372 family glycosyltransferase [Pseudomonadota bacterium]
MTTRDALRQRLSLEPSHLDAIVAYCLSTLNAGRFSDCRTMAERALAISPDNYLALFSLFHALSQQNHTETLFLVAKKLFALDPASESSFYSVIQYHIVKISKHSLSKLELAVFFAWTMRSVSTYGLRDYSAHCLTSWFRDRIDARRLADIFHILGTTSNRTLETARSKNGTIKYLITDDSTRYIGEMAALFDYLHKMFRLGRLPKGDIHVLADAAPISNPAAFDLWSASVKPITAAGIAAAGEENFVRLNTTYLPYGKRYYLKTVVYCIIQREWERKGLRGLLNKNANIRGEDEFSKLLAERGWTRDDKIVCLHIREDVFNRDTVNRETQRFRNSDPRKIQSSLLYLTRQGYKIIRIGAQNTFVYEAMDGFFDYANSGKRSPELDVEILRICSFYFGSESGPFSLAIAFDKPCCTINLAQLSYGVMPGRCVYSTKLFLNRISNRIVPMSYLLHAPFRYISDQRVLDDHNIIAIENSAEEVLMTVKEFLRRLARDDFHDPSSFGQQQRQACKIFKRNRVVSNGLLCEDFLRKYQYFVA